MGSYPLWKTFDSLGDEIPYFIVSGSLPVLTATKILLAPSNDSPWPWTELLRFSEQPSLSIILLGGEGRRTLDFPSTP